MIRFYSFFVTGHFLCLSPDVENGHVSTNLTVRMLFMFICHVMQQEVLRKLLVLQHVENLDVISVMRGT
jgi:hypothetical protein